MFGLIDLTQAFPKLRAEGYRRTSPRSIDYNCFAHAGGDDTKRWDILPFHCWWPDSVEKKITPETIVEVYRLIRYELCGDGEFEEGFEKIAIYVKDGRPKHAARQLQDGSWTSKLGDEIDVTHTLAGLEGEVYGRVEIYMRRAR